MYERLKDSKLSYPDNIAAAIGIATEITDDIRQKTIDLVETSDILSDKEKHCVLAYYKDNRTYNDIKNDYDVSPERIRQIISKSIFALRRNKSKYIPPYRCIIRLKKDKTLLGYIAIEKYKLSPKLVNKQGYATIFYNQTDVDNWITFIKSIYNDNQKLHIELIQIH